MERSPLNQNSKAAAGNDGDAAGRDRNLLFGIFAIQMRLIEAEAFLEAAAAWSTNPSVSLADRLIQSGVMTVADYELVNGIVSATIQRHGGDASHTFQHVGGEANLATQLATIASSKRDELGKTLGIPLRAPVLGDVLLGEDINAVAESPGRYNTRSEYRRGGMGRILLVHDEYLSRDVALKELLPDRASDGREAPEDSPGRVISSYAVRFLKEARITAQLEHPSIVPVHEIGQRNDGSHYYTMKLVRGETLGAALQRARTPKDRLTYLNHYRDLCQAIAYAHSRHVIHRDIKPSNVMLGEFGETVVIDWGLAKILGQTDEYEAELTKSWNQLKDQPFDQLARTTPGARVGTPQYMSPEQADGRLSDVDERSDVFALGILLYEILTGQRPFSGISTQQLFENIRLAAYVPIDEITPAIPKELGSICDRALQKDPEDRYASAKELWDDIDRFLTGAIVQAYEYSPVELARRVYERNKAMIHTALAASVLLLAMGVGASVNVLRSRNAAVVARDNALHARQQAESTNYVNQIRLVHSYLRDHNEQRANEILWATQPELRQWEWGYLLNKANQDLYTITGNHGFAISHDNARIACFYRFQPVTIYDAQNGSLIRSLTPPPTEWVRRVQFNADDSHLMIRTESGQVQIWDAQSWELIGNLQAHPNGAADATFLPDGRMLTSGDDGTVAVWNADLRQESPSMSANAPLVRQIMCSTDGARAAAILGQNDQREIQVWEIASRESIGIVSLDEDAEYVQVAPLANQAAWASGAVVKICDLESSEVVHQLDAFPSGISGLDYDSIGTRLAVTGHDRMLSVWDTETGQRIHVVRSGHPIMKPKWSPDDQLICTLPEPYNGYPQVWSSSSMQLVNDLGVHTLPAVWYDFFPDSVRLLTSGGDRTTKIWNALSGASQQVVHRQDERVVDLVVSANGKRFATVDFVGVVSVIDTNLGNVLAEFSSQVATPKVAISPDGNLVLTMLDTVVPAVLDVEENKLVSTFSEHDSAVRCVAISSNGKHFASASWDGMVYVWNPISAELTATFQHDVSPTTLAFGGNGDQLVIGDETGTITIYQWESGTLLQRAKEHSSPIVALQSTEDGLRLASAEEQGWLVVWSLRAGEIVKEWIRKGHAREPSSVAFLDDGKRLASCSSDGVRLWDSATGDEILALASPSELSTVIRAVPGGDDLLSAQGRIIRRWIPAPWKQISSSEAMQAEFQKYRRDMLDQPAISVPDAPLHRRVVVIPNETVTDSLEGWKNAVAEESDAIRFETDDSKGMRIVAGTEGLAFSIGVAVGDVIQSIDGNETTSAELALTAIETAMKSKADDRLSVQIVRAGRTRQITVLRRPIKTETVVISLTRQQAIDRYDRFAEALRSLLRSNAGTNAADIARDGGILLTENLGKQDRALLRLSGVAPDDVVVKFSGDPVSSVRQLIQDVNALVASLKSEKVSEFELEVRRGRFRQVNIVNQIK